MIAKILKFILLMILPAYLTAAYVYADKEYEKEVCNNIKIVLLNKKENQYLSQLDIKTIISNNNLVKIGDKLSKINRDNIERNIKKNQIIKNTECYITPSGSVVIEVEQRIPVMRLITDKGSYYVDSDREIMPLSEKITAYLPIITGKVDEKSAKTELYDFVEYIENHKIWKNQIEQIVVSNNNEIELIPRIGKQLILFGKLSNFEQKLRELELLYTKTFATIGWNHYNKINLRYEGRIICTKN